MGDDSVAAFACGFVYEACAYDTSREFIVDRLKRRKGKLKMKGLFGSRAVCLAVVLSAVTGVWLFATGAASAATFTQCPTVGYDTGCAVLFTVNANGSVTTSTDGTQGPFEGVEDTLVGVQNNSAGSLRSLTLSGSGIFGFESDGACSGLYQGGPSFPGSYTPPSGCPFGSTGYEGPGTSFSVSNASNGTVVFAGAGLAAGTSTWFSLEGPPSSSAGATIEQPIILYASTFSPVEGASFSGTVATATDADPSSTGAEYSCTIDWGDGSALDTTSCAVSGTGGSFIVSGTHTYAEEGSYSVTVTATDTDNSFNSGTTTSTANVTDAALSAGTLTLSGGVEGVSAGSASFGFSDANPGATAGDFTATIDWGDASTPTFGTVTGPTGGPFTVTGSHQYAEEGLYTVMVTVTDDGGSTTSASGSTTVADATIAASCATPAVSPQSFNGTVAGLTDSNTGASAGDFTATINWGDSSTSNGSVSGSGGTYSVAGNHTYTSTGYYNITTKVTDDGGSTSTTTACRVLVFAFAPGRGAFVIGNGNSANGTAVTFWGAQWWKLNTLSGGAAPAAFKGYALNPAVPSCNTGWSTDPGNSAPPPAGPLPAYMGVIVTSSTTMSGSQISGNTPHIVIVHTNPGYDPNVGHAGTGTVVAPVC